MTYKREAARQYQAAPLDAETKAEGFSTLICNDNASEGWLSIPLLNRAERTPGAVAVSGIYGRAGGDLKLPAGIPLDKLKT